MLGDADAGDPAGGFPLRRALAILLVAGSAWAQPFTAIDDTHDQTVGGIKTHVKLKLNPVTFAGLSALTPTDGWMQYCSDCAMADPCVGGGTGALAVRMNSVWNCLSGSGGLGADGTNCTAGEFAAGVDASGNAQSCDVPPTADALTTNPSDCSANQYANAIAANGNLTCGSITDADVPNSITITLAQTATALAANGTNCSAGQYPLGVDASGVAESCTTVAFKSNFTGGTGKNTLATGATNYFPVSGPVDATGTENEYKQVVSTTGVASRLFCNLPAGSPDNGGGTQTYTFTLRKNTADTALTCAISEAGQTCSDTSNTVAVTAGDLIDFSSVPSGTPTARSVTCSIEYAI